MVLLVLNVFIPHLCNKYFMGFNIILVNIFLAFIISVSVVSAHGVEENPLTNLPDPVTILYYTLWISGLAVISSLVFKMNRTEKKVVFLLIAAPVAISTLYLSGHTVYLNLISESRGPVHWHADYEVWVCDKKLDLMDPTGFENRVGSPVLHEHNDNRIHAEGVLVKISDASLEEYFEVISGELHEDELSYPTNSGTISVKNGDLCSGKPGKLQAFVYKTLGKRYQQEKLADFPQYVLSPYSQVPPGDCIIIEFGEEKTRTDKVCSTYVAAINKGDIK